MKDRIASIQKEFDAEKHAVTDSKSLEMLKAKYTAKSGIVSDLLRGMRDVLPEDRKEVGMLVNELKIYLETEVGALEEKISAAALSEKLSSEKIDITEPAAGSEKGAIHPFYQLFEKMVDRAVEMGFTQVCPPELDSEWYVFEALNSPSDHPSRDMHDTFYVDIPGYLLSSHTSNSQIRTMEKTKPPLKIFSLGRVYRNDSDATHSPMFQQFEGLVVDEGISLADLKRTLTDLVRAVAGEKVNIRFRPSYFPFTEPSVEVDMTCPLCNNAGCRLCKGSGWLEICGAGLVNRKVLENCGIDSQKYSGFAFGFGADRFAMLLKHVPELHLFYDGDVRFLRQFK